MAKPIAAPCMAIDHRAIMPSSGSTDLGMLRSRLAMNAKGRAMFIMKAERPRRKAASTAFTFFAANPIAMMTNIDKIFSRITD